MPAGSLQQGGERLLPRQGPISLQSSQTLPGSILSITRPNPTNTDSNTGSATLPLSTSSLSLSTGASSSSGSSVTSSSVPSASLGPTSSSPISSPISSPSSSSAPSTPSTSSTTSESSTFTTHSGSSATSSSSSLTGSSTASVPTTSNAMSSTTETSSSISSSPTSVVVVHSHVNTGAIVGGVIGGVVFLILIIAGLLLYLRIRRQIPTRSRRRSMGEFDAGRPAGQWAGLSSRENSFQAVAVPPRSHQRSGSRSYPQADAMGMVVAPTDHGQRSPSSPEEAAMAAASHAQKPRAGRRRSEYIETVPPLEYAPQPVGPEGTPRHGRKPSTGSSTRAVALAQLNTAAANSSSSTAHSAHSRQQSVDRSAHPSTPSAAHTGGAPASPTSPTSPYAYAAEAMSRSTSTSVGGPRRNPTRKPVPSYHSSVSAASTEKRRSTASTPAQSLTPAHSREDLAGSGRRPGAAADLAHKASFGDRPVHYLVPDLPPPRK